MKLIAQGTVKRTGKLAKQTSTQRVSDVPVDFGQVSATVNVDGVNVTFGFAGWRNTQPDQASNDRLSKLCPSRAASR